MVRLFPFKAVKSTTEIVDGLVRSDSPPLSQSPIPTTALPTSWHSPEYPKSRSSSRSSSDEADICDRFEATQSSVAPIMVVSPERALSNRLGIEVQSLRDFINFDLLSQETEDSFYIYSLSNGDHVQIGICAAVSVEDYRQGVIKRHEKTRKERMRNFNPQHENMGPIMVMYRESKDVNTIVNEVIKRPPHVTVDHENIIHRIWSVSNGQELEDIQYAFNAVDCLYIADGHHRAASVSKSYDESGSCSFNSHFMAVVFPHTQLRILPYHRCLTSIGDKSSAEFLDYVSQKFIIEEIQIGCDPQPKLPQQFSMFLVNKWYNLKPIDEINITETTINPVKSLDVQILFDRLLQPLLGVKNCRTDERIHYVAGVDGYHELERLVLSGTVVVAFCMKEVSVETVMKIADAGLLMPPKATWFDPKLLTGLLVSV